MYLKVRKEEPMSKKYCRLVADKRVQYFDPIDFSSFNAWLPKYRFVWNLVDRFFHLVVVGILRYRFYARS